MGDRSGFLSRAAPGLGAQGPYYSDGKYAAVLMHADESLPLSSPLEFRAASRSQHQLAVETSAAAYGASQRLAPSFPKGRAGEEDRIGSQAQPLHAFFYIDPHRAAATVSPAEEDALTQRRWRADTAEVEAFLTQLDLAREECAAAGLYTKAQACVLRMDQTLHLFAERLHAETDAVASRTRERMTEQFKRDRLDLRKQWRDKVAACRRDAAALIAATAQHYDAQLVKEDMAMRVDLRRSGDCEDASDEGSSGPSWSKEVPHLQMELHQYLCQRRYRDAERVRAQLQRLKRQETADRLRGVTQQHAQRMQALHAAQASALVEMQAVQRQEVQEMVLAGRAALDQLTKSHLAALQSTEDRRLHLHTETREMLREYAHTDVVDPKATALKLIRLSQLLWPPPRTARG